MAKIDMYPITIIKDRYTGAYSKGEWTAWNCDPCDVPEEIFEDDITCFEFWMEAYNRMLNGEIPVFGVSNSIDGALLDVLDNKMRKERKDNKND